jgi:hypothetical protein
VGGASFVIFASIFAILIIFRRRRQPPSSLKAVKPQIDDLLKQNVPVNEEVDRALDAFVFNYFGVVSPPSGDDLLQADRKSFQLNFNNPSFWVCGFWCFSSVINHVLLITIYQLILLA